MANTSQQISRISANRQPPIGMTQEWIKEKITPAHNCSAGKDRTGMAAALILTALDVPRDIIEQDYAMTEKIANFGQREMFRRMRAEQQGKTAAAPPLRHRSHARCCAQCVYGFRPHVYPCHV